MEPDIQITARTEELTKSLEYLSGISAGKDPNVKRALQQAGKYLLEKGKQRLISRHKDTGGLPKRMTVVLFKNKKGVKIGFAKEGWQSTEHHKNADADSLKKWFGMKPWIYDLGSYKGNRHTKKGFNRGAVRGSKFWSETTAQDSAAAMNMIQDAIERSIEKIMTT